jgi:HlyD family secretion protein
MCVKFGRHNWMKKWFALSRPVAWIVIAAVAVVITAWWWHERSGHQLLFRTAVVKRGDIAATISATGTLEPVEVVDVGAQVAGQINSFGTDTDGKTIDYRSTVEEGAVLAKIDESVYAAELAVANAQLAQGQAGVLSAAANVEQAKAKFVQAEGEWNRAQSLTTSKLLATADSDTARANYEVAKANVSVAEASLAQARANTVQAQAAVDKAQRNLGFCTIKSPVKGVIIDRRVNIGQTVVSSFNAPSLFLIAKDLTKMQIWVGVNEADVGRIKSGAPVTFNCDAFPGREFSGSVGKVRLNASMTQNVVMFTVEVNTENPDNLLLPYMTANVHFIVQKESGVLLVPNAALRWSPSSPAQISLDARSSKLDPPGDSGPKASKKDKPAMKSAGTIWVKDGEFVRPVEVTVGTSDGISTSIVADTLQEGQEVVTGETTQAAQAGIKNPFIPQVPQRR